MDGEEEQIQGSVMVDDHENEDNGSDQTSFNNGGTGTTSNSDWSSGCSSFIQRPPPPFLLKTYDIVNNPDTDSIVSWNTNGTSLIIWDAHKFVAEIMNKYFRHNNFASFVCQLNTYGFKKISWDKWEYQNEWFRKGEIHCLKNIKRAGSSRGVVSQAKSQEEPISQTTTLEKQQNLENLINEQKMLSEEIVVLKRQLENSEKELKTIKTEMHIRNNKQQKLFMIVTQALLKEKKEVENNQVAEIEQEQIESLVIPDDSMEPLNKSVKKSLCHVHEKGKEKEKDMDMEDNSNSESNRPVFSDEKYKHLEKLLMDDVNIDKVPLEENGKCESKIVIELEDLIGERVDWIKYHKELGDKASCVKSNTDNTGHEEVMLIDD